MRARLQQGNEGASCARGAYGCGHRQRGKGGGEDRLRVRAPTPRTWRAPHSPESQAPPRLTSAQGESGERESSAAAFGDLRPSRDRRTGTHTCPRGRRRREGQSGTRPGRRTRSRGAGAARGGGGPSRAGARTPSRRGRRSARGTGARGAGLRSRGGVSGRGGRRGRRVAPSVCACRNTLAMASTYVACESRLRASV